MATSKDRRNSGWTSPQLTIPYKDARHYNLDINLNYWDDWHDWRDGMRHNPDRSMIRSSYMWAADYGEVEKFNKKLKKKEVIRKARKLSPRNKL